MRISDWSSDVCSSDLNGKHVALMNAELDGTVGPLLKRKADAAGVIYTNVNGDQPGVILKQYRFVKGIGLRPVLCGNIQGLQDRKRVVQGKSVSGRVDVGGARIIIQTKNCKKTV